MFYIYLDSYEDVMAGNDRGATGERQDSDREATGKRQGSDRGLKVPKQRQGGDREATGWRQEGEVARIQ